MNNNQQNKGIVRRGFPFCKKLLVMSAMLLSAQSMWADNDSTPEQAQDRYKATAKKIDETRKVVVDDGSERDYWLYVPQKVNAGTYKNVPLVFALHGGSEDYQPTHSGNLNFNSLADANNFIVVYGRGKERMFPHFNPNPARAWLATGEANEDTRYFESIIDTLNKTFSIDNDRIYMAGFSVGGMMTYATSNVLSDKIAAFASISGLPMNEVHLRHHGARPVPFMHVHGTKDSFVRYELMPTIVDNMLCRNGFSYTPDQTTSGKCNVWGDGDTTYKKYVYGKDSTTPYIYYQIGTGSKTSDKGMGHNNWCSIDGKDVQQVMWEFLKKYRLSDERNTDIEFKADINTANTIGRNHGWKINYGTTTLVKYGESGGYTTSGQNVYHTIQLNPGTHYLKFTTALGEEGQYVSVKLTRLGALSNFSELMGKNTSPYFKTTSRAIINNVKYLADNQQTVVEFTTDETAEYMLTITKGSGSDNTQISGIEITKTGTPTPIPTSLDDLLVDPSNSPAEIYDLKGTIVSHGTTQSLPKGLYISKGKKIVNNNRYAK